jgi:hypothetical protein
LLAIRYKDGRPGYFERNHFPEADWIPNNLKANILQDVTAKVAQDSGVVAKVESKTIDRGKWLQKQSQKRGVASQNEVNQELMKSVDVRLPYIAIRAVDDVIHKIPNGAILNLVHKDDGHHPVLITHQGFVIREGERVLLRHASRGGRIRTSDLSSYLKGLIKQQKANSKWPLIGVNLNQINASASASNLRSEAM